MHALRPGTAWLVTAITIALQVVDLVRFIPDAVAFLKVTRGYHQRNGVEFLVSYLKEAQRITVKYLAGEDAGPRSATSPRVDRRSGLPTILPVNLRQLITEGDTNAVRVALTLLGLYRILVYPADAKTSTITEKLKWSFTLTDMMAFRAVTYSCLEHFTVPDLERPNLHSSNRTGPNGHATLSAHWDAFALLKSPTIWEAWKGLAYRLNVPDLITRVQRLAELTAQLDCSHLVLGQPVIGRIAEKQEAAGKVRLFAIPDYWTQCLLRVVHRALFEILKQIPTDCTFDQGAGFKRVVHWNAQGRTLYCYDLSAATDRFPIDLQLIVLSTLWGEQLGHCWRALLQERDYWYSETTGRVVRPDGVKVKTKRWVPLRYGAGQPMGAYSSWAAFALTHHVSVQYAARLAGHDYKKWFMDYVILGDDICIADASVAAGYRQLMERLGVPINLSKSLVGGAAEFAKRYAYKGTEVTGIPLKELVLAYQHLELFPVFLLGLRSKGWTIKCRNVLQSIIGDPNLRFGSSKRQIRLLLYTLLAPWGFFPLRVRDWLNSDNLRLMEAEWLHQDRSSQVEDDQSARVTSRLERQTFRLSQEINSALGYAPAIDLSDSYLRFANEALPLALAKRVRAQFESLRQWITAANEGLLPSLITGWVERAGERKDFSALRVTGQGTLFRDIIQLHPAMEVAVAASKTKANIDWQWSKPIAKTTFGDGLRLLEASGMPEIIKGAYLSANLANSVRRDALNRHALYVRDLQVERATNRRLRRQDPYRYGDPVADAAYIERQRAIQRANAAGRNDGPAPGSGGQPPQRPKRDPGKLFGFDI